MDRNYEELISAIVLQAFKDLRLARHKLKKDPDDLESLRMIGSVYAFLKSDWCEFLIGFDGNWLIKKFEEKIWDT